MILYQVEPWKEEDDCNFSPCRRRREAIELGNEFYPEGYDIIEIDTDEINV